jgi:serine/threonine protein kinase
VGCRQSQVASKEYTEIDILFQFAEANLTDESNQEKKDFELSLDQANAAFSEATLSTTMQPYVVLAPGEIILEKYRIIELLGRGGMGSVYRVENLLVNRIYALKCLSKAQADDSSWRRFQNEAKAAHMLDHANLIRVYDFGLLPGGQPYFLMELVDGPTLADEIKKNGKLDLERALKIFIHVAFAIQYAHSHKIVHRDLKPSNIMLVKPHDEQEHETVKVVDFGIAKLTGVDEFNQQTLTKTGEIFGSPLYMSPEQCMGIAVDHRSDLYSLGCVFYETLTGAPPFIGDSALSTMLKHQSENPLSLKEASLGEEFPDEIETVIRTLLEKDPDKRYQSANRLAEDLILLEKSLRSGEGTVVKTALNNAAHKLEKEKEKLTIVPSIYITIAACAATFVLGLLFCYWLITMQPVTPKISQPKLISLQPFDSKAAIAPAPHVSVQVKPWATRTRKFVEYHFPETVSLGIIEFRDGSTKTATGLVKIPIDKPIGLLVSKQLLLNPELLDGFQPDDLQVLSFGGAKTVSSGVYKHLNRLTGLKMLNLSGTDFNDDDLRNIAGLNNLRYLNLATTRVTCGGVLRLPFLSNIKCLDIAGARGADLFVKKIADLPNLKSLVIAGSDIGDDDLKDIAKSKSLKVLSLANDDISNQGLKHLLSLKTLEWIDVTQTGVTYDSCEILAKMPGLKKIEMGSVLKDEEKAEFDRYLQKHRPEIQTLWKNVNTLDLDSCLPEFPWYGRCIKSHTDLDFTKFVDLPKF